MKKEPAETTEKHPITKALSYFRQCSERMREVKLRFVMPLIVVITAKIAGAVWLYSRLDHSISHSGWFWDLLGPVSQIDFFHIFFNWDSVFFMSNAAEGYPDYFCGSYAFLPGYPLVIRALYMIAGDLGAAAALSALVFGVAWTPFFQALAEQYMSQREAVACTLMTAFFPTVFLFTTVAYSEPMFLFACVASWYFYKKEKLLYACLMAAVATITRIYGIFIVIPMFLDLLLRREWRRLPYTLIPPLTLAGWFGYCLLKTGDWLASLHAETFFPAYVPYFGRWVVPFYSGSYVPFTPTEMVFIAVIGLLAFLSWRIDWRLALYAAITFFGILGFAGPPERSYLRFFSFIFPIWLNVKTENRVVTGVVCAFFYVHALMAWYQFHVGWIA